VRSGMNHVYKVAAIFRGCLIGLADWLFGCSHRRTTFPVSRRAGATVDGLQSAESETYVVCLECGRHFTYDWAAMHANKHATSGPLPGGGYAGHRTTTIPPVLNRECRIDPEVQAPAAMKTSHERNF
jgi:hypothetical protein